MTRLNLTFSECEHSGDLERYEEDIRKCGGTIIMSDCKPDDEEGYIMFNVEDRKDFIEKFRKTESYGFSQ